MVLCLFGVCNVHSEGADNAAVVRMVVCCGFMDKARACGVAWRAAAGTHSGLVHANACGTSSLRANTIVLYCAACSKLPRARPFGWLVGGQGARRTYTANATGHDDDANPQKILGMIQKYIRISSLVSREGNLKLQWPDRRP